MVIFLIIAAVKYVTVVNYPEYICPRVDLAR